MATATTTLAANSVIAGSSWSSSNSQLPKDLAAAPLVPVRRSPLIVPTRTVLTPIISSSVNPPSSDLPMSGNSANSGALQNRTERDDRREEEQQQSEGDEEEEYDDDEEGSSRLVIKE